MSAISICTKPSASRTAAAAPAWARSAWRSISCRFLPRRTAGAEARSDYAICAAPLGSASILTIPWMYIRMMGGEGLTDATKLAILNANYIARRLDPYFPVLFHGRAGYVAHECIIDLRQLQARRPRKMSRSG